MEMKPCKECGKLFMPKTGREAYCSDIHYRPCPDCGKPVIAKYLSDPARRCDDCKKAARSASKKPDDNQIKLDDGVLAQVKVRSIKKGETLPERTLVRTLYNKSKVYEVDEDMGNVARIRSSVTGTCCVAKSDLEIVLNK